MDDRIVIGEFVRDFDAESSKKVLNNEANDPKDKEDKDIYNIKECSKQSINRLVNHSKLILILSLITNLQFNLKVSLVVKK